MPEEVFRLWLDQRIENNGWPPVGPTWENVLRQIPFNRWQRLSWRETTLDLRVANVTLATSAVLESLKAAIFYRQNNEYSEMSIESRRKTGDILVFIHKNQRLPSKLIFVETSFGYELVDGCHRLATFICLSELGTKVPPISPLAPAWVGFDGEE